MEKQMETQYKELLKWNEPTASALYHVRMLPLLKKLSKKYGGRPMVITDESNGNLFRFSFGF